MVWTSTYPDFVVPFVVRECTAWNDKAKPDWEQMKKLAINVTPAIRSSRNVGFRGQGSGRNEATKEMEDEADFNEVGD